MKIRIRPAHNAHDKGSPDSIYNYDNHCIYIFICVAFIYLKLLNDYRPSPCLSNLLTEPYHTIPQYEF